MRMTSRTRMPPASAISPTTCPTAAITSPHPAAWKSRSAKRWRHAVRATERAVRRGRDGERRQSAGAFAYNDGRRHLRKYIVLDPKLLRSDLPGVAALLARRGFVLDVARLAVLEEQRKAAQIEADRLRAE